MKKKLREWVKEDIKTTVNWNRSAVEQREERANNGMEGRRKWKEGKVTVEGCLACSLVSPLLSGGGGGEAGGWRARGMAGESGVR